MNLDSSYLMINLLLVIFSYVLCALLLSVCSCLWVLLDCEHILRGYCSATSNYALLHYLVVHKHDVLCTHTWRSCAHTLGDCLWPGNSATSVDQKMILWLWTRLETTLTQPLVYFICALLFVRRLHSWYCHSLKLLVFLRL